MRILCFVAAIAVAACATPTTPTMTDRCAYDQTTMMNLDPEAFDRTPGSGWRIVGDIEGCEGAAADLIANYRAQLVDNADTKGLLHHEAQLRAAAGQTSLAVALFEQVRTLETEPAMQAYRDAEVAFLRNDQNALTEAREQLLGIPEPRGFNEAVTRFRERYPDLPPPSWPPNLDVIDAFITCFGRPYREAYLSQECRPTD